MATAKKGAPAKRTGASTEKARPAATKVSPSRAVKGSGGVWDELHLNPATDHRVVHNYIGGTNWEWHIEWVGGGGGEIRENTFVGPVRAYNVEAAVTTGNVSIP